VNLRSQPGPGNAAGRAMHSGNQFSPEHRTRRRRSGGTCRFVRTKLAPNACHARQAPVPPDADHPPTWRL